MCKLNANLATLSFGLVHDKSIALPWCRTLLGLVSWETTFRRRFIRVSNTNSQVVSRIEQLRRTVWISHVVAAESGTRCVPQ